MINPTPEDFGKDLSVLSRRLQVLQKEFSEHGLISREDKASLDRVQQEKEQLAARLFDIGRKAVNWNLIKAEFGGAWNSFVADLQMLELRLLESETIKERERNPEEIDDL